MIELRQLRYFVAVAETLHFGRAAERLHVTQPPLSRQVAALEQVLGVRLIERNSRHARLTAAGALFLAEARGILASVDQACRDVRRADAGELGELTVGFMMHAAYGSLPPLTRRFIAAYPDVTLHLRETLPAALAAGVLDGEFDAAIGFAPGVVRGLASMVLHREPLCVALPEDHKLAAYPELTRALVAPEPLIASPGDVTPSLRRTIEAYLAPVGAPQIRLETQLQQTIISLVGQGIGIALVPQSLRNLGMAGVVFRPLEDAPEIEQVLMWRVGASNPVLPNLLNAAGDI